MTSFFEKNIVEFPKLMNAFLVEQDGRQVALLESPSERVKNFVKFLNLKETYHREGLLVSKNVIVSPRTTEEMGRLLGFHCPGAEPDKITRIFRIGTTVEEHGVIYPYAEICPPQININLQRRADLWNEIMIRNHLPYHFEVATEENLSTDYKLELLHRFRFRSWDESDPFLEHLDKYRDDMNNYTRGISFFSAAPDEEIVDNVDVLKFLYPKAINFGRLDPKTIIQFEDDIFSSTPDKWDKIYEKLKIRLPDKRNI